MGIMHEINFHDGSLFTEKRNIKPRPEFCPDCQSTGQSSKLEFSFIGLSSGIWMCSNVKCNFPLNSEDLQVYIEAVDPFHDKEIKLRKQKLKKLKPCFKCKERRGPCKMNYISSAEDSSLAISKTFRKHGKVCTKNLISQSAVSYNGLNALPVSKRKEKAELCYSQFDQKSETGEVSLPVDRAYPSNTSFNFSQGTTFLQTSKSQIRHGESEHDVGDLKCLTKYAPFALKREGGNENDEGFVVVESKVLAVVDESMTGVRKDSGVEECYDSAYSSPSSDELNLQQQDFTSFLHYQTPVFESALKMIDSIFSSEARKENYTNKVSFDDETFDMLGDDVDLSKFC